MLTAWSPWTTRPLLIETMYNTTDVVEQRRVTLDLLDPQSGEDILDVGSGPGYLAAGIAKRVRPRGSVRGVDPSASMRAIAVRRLAEKNAAIVRFGPGEAADLPFPDGTFDAVTATQV